MQHSQLILTREHRPAAIRWRRLAVIACGTLVLCSCRAQSPSGHGPALRPPMETLPPSAFAGQDAPGPMSGPMPGQMPGGMLPNCGPQCGLQCGPPLACTSLGGDCCNQCPPYRPVHDDEYLHDGGDQGVIVTAAPDTSVRGLDVEDTVVNFECRDGRVFVQPSNRVCIYAPRFASVRKVDGAISGNQVDQLVGVDQPLKPVLHDETQKPGAAMQPLEAITEIGNRKAVAFRERLKDEGLETAVRLVGVQDALLPYENFSIIKLGIYEQGEKPRLAQRVEAAIVWTANQGVQVVIGKQQAAIEGAVRSAETVYRVDQPDCPRLRVCKVASTHDALPGEVVDFTIRFDNIGQGPMKHVTIYDNLTTRLEYVPDTAQSSVKAKFYSQLNEADSLVLKWTLDEPLEPGHGGIVRFRCKVR